MSRQPRAGICPGSEASCPRPGYAARVRSAAKGAASSAHSATLRQSCAGIPSCCGKEPPWAAKRPLRRGPEPRGRTVSRRSGPRKRGHSRAPARAQAGRPTGRMRAVAGCTGDTVRKDDKTSAPLPRS